MRIRVKVALAHLLPIGLEHLRLLALRLERDEGLARRVVQHRHRLRLRRHSHRRHEVADLTGTVGRRRAQSRSRACGRGSSPPPPPGRGRDPAQGARDRKPPAFASLPGACPHRAPARYLALQTKTVSQPGHRPEAAIFWVRVRRRTSTALKDQGRPRSRATTSSSPFASRTEPAAASARAPAAASAAETSMAPPCQTTTGAQNLYHGRCVPVSRQATLRQAHLVFDRALALDRLLLLPVLRTALLPLVRLLDRLVERDVVCAAAAAAGQPAERGAVGGGAEQHLLRAWLSRSRCRSPRCLARRMPRQRIYKLATGTVERTLLL